MLKHPMVGKQEQYKQKDYIIITFQVHEMWQPKALWKIVKVYFEMTGPF